jgi:hypothetical protein
MMKIGSTIKNHSLKKQSMELNHPSSPAMKNFKAQASAGKITHTLFG